jgi:predicted dehydrogenase
VSGAARIPRTVREIRTDPRRGEPFAVTVPTHVSSALEFSSGPIAIFVASFDVWSTRYRNIEVYGTEGTLSVPDPNYFEGTVMIQRTGEFEWSELDPVAANVPQQRGLGLADMVWAENTGRAHRASDALALHVLEVMSATLASADAGHRIALTTTCDRAAPLAVSLPPNTFDD